MTVRDEHAELLVKRSRLVNLIEGYEAEAAEWADRANGLRPELAKLDARLAELQATLRTGG